MAHQEASDILLEVRFSSHHWCVDPPLTEAMSLPPGVSCSSGSVKGQENDSGLPCSLQGWQRWTHQIHHIGTPEKSQWLWSWETRGYLENKWWDTVRCHLRQSTWVGHITAHNCISRGTQSIHSTQACAVGSNGFRRGTSPWFLFQVTLLEHSNHSRVSGQKAKWIWRVCSPALLIWFSLSSWGQHRPGRSWFDS